MLDTMQRVKGFKQVYSEIFQHFLAVTNILSAFNVWEETFPDYGITAILELLQNKITKEYGVEVSFSQF